MTWRSAGRNRERRHLAAGTSNGLMAYCLSGSTPAPRQADPGSHRIHGIFEFTDCSLDDFPSHFRLMLRSGLCDQHDLQTTPQTILCDDFSDSLGESPKYACHPISDNLYGYGWLCHGQFAQAPLACCSNADRAMHQSAQTSALAAMLIFHRPNPGFGSLAHTRQKYLPGFAGQLFRLQGLIDEYDGQSQRKEQHDRRKRVVNNKAACRDKVN